MTGDSFFIAVDVGNSSLGIACYDLESMAAPLPEPIWQNQFLYGQLENPGWWEEIAARIGPASVDWFIASVNRPRDAWLTETIRRARPTDRWHLIRRDDLDLEVEVSEPQAVGIDRLVAAVAVNQLRSEKRPAIVIDSGSAVTIDLVDADGCFCGGAILPGHRMAASALARQTDLLPEVKVPLSPPVVLGRSTSEAIASGVYWGTLGGVLEIVRRMRSQAGADAEIFLTGGGIPWRDELPGDVTCHPDLVHTGIALAAGYLLRQARRDGG
ncbi:MAG: type III pantothenate kinase [Planctomycetota bacterium]|nr:type III pantothenate kinase [Planctomycetota bacterium]